MEHPDARPPLSERHRHVAVRARRATRPHSAISCRPAHPRQTNEQQPVTHTDTIPGRAMPARDRGAFAVGGNDDRAWVPGRLSTNKDRLGVNASECDAGTRRCCGPERRFGGAAPAGPKPKPLRRPPDVSPRPTVGQAHCAAPPDGSPRGPGRADHCAPPARRFTAWPSRARPLRRPSQAGIGVVRDGAPQSRRRRSRLPAPGAERSARRACSPPTPSNLPARTKVRRSPTVGRLPFGSHRGVRVRAP